MLYGRPIEAVAAPEPCNQHSGGVLYLVLSFEVPTSSTAYKVCACGQPNLRPPKTALAGCTVWEGRIALDWCLVCRTLGVAFWS